VSTDRQRDAETDRLLRAVLQTGVHHDACPDANMLAAFAEGALAAPERDDLETHFAECHRCQEALAFIARTWTAPDAALPVASARWRFFRPRWLVPLAAAAILVMYVAVRPVIAPYFPPATIGPASEVAQTAAPVQVMADARPATPAESTPPPAAAQAIADTRPMASKSIASTPDAKGSGQPAARSAEKAMLAAAKPSADIAAPVGGIAAPTATASPDRAVAMAKDVRREVLPAAPPAAGAGALPRTAISESVVVSPPAVTTQAASVSGGDAARQQFAMKANESIALPEVASPDGAAAWVIGPGGRLSRSTDRGVTWRTQVSGVSVELLAGSAPSAVVCWMVGTAGTVIVTTDGTRWSRVAFPERVDLVAVEASDARVATVTTRDGRRFATRDAGTTWSPK